MNYIQCCLHRCSCIMIMFNFNLMIKIILSSLDENQIKIQVEFKRYPQRINKCLEACLWVIQKNLYCQLISRGLRQIYLNINTSGKASGHSHAKHRSSHCFLAFTRCPLKLVSNFLLSIEKLNVIDKKGRYEGTVYSIHAT